VKREKLGSILPASGGIGSNTDLVKEKGKGTCPEISLK
jgi:hypothetical protein